MTKEQQRTLEIALSQYLPYGVKLWDRDSEPGSEVILLTGMCVTAGVTTVSDEHGNFDIPLEDVKPILRPLSDLTKPITHNGEAFTPMKELAAICVGGINSVAKSIEMVPVSLWPMWIVDKLTEWLFDYRCLINQGLAISVHDLTENPYL